ncbi:MAG TPA: alpha/beta fold hydrolase, partial [Gemmataceae bacterium]|nr:alpha/beta fold hydrolase [Gemmataceae bacterium]
ARTGNPEQLTAWQKTKVLFTGVNIPRPVNYSTPVSLGIPFEIYQFSGKEGVSLEGWWIPSRLSSPRGIVVLFHGYAGCKADLLQEAAGVHEMGYAAFLVDFRGSGGSSGSQTSIGVWEADDVFSTCRFVQERWPNLPVALFGQSMGSAAILRAIAEFSIRPDCLILECPFDSLLSTVANRFQAMNLPSFPLSQLLVFWGGIQNGFNGFNHNPSEYAAKVQCPVLMLHGELDVRVTRAQANNIFKKLPVDKEFQTFENVGHASYIGVRPDEWKMGVKKFLNRYLQPH